MAGAVSHDRLAEDVRWAAQRLALDLLTHDAEPLPVDAQLFCEQISIRFNGRIVHVHLQTADPLDSEELWVWAGTHHALMSSVMDGECFPTPADALTAIKEHLQ